MPGRDNTGPQGTGPIGRRMGGCTGEPGAAMPFGFGRRMGSRGGRRGIGLGGRSWKFGAAPAVELNTQKAFLEKQLERINQLLGMDNFESQS